MAVAPPRWNPTISRALCFVAAVCFLLAAFGVHFAVIDVVDLGLALFALAFVL
jgi:hypothetical protein